MSRRAQSGFTLVELLIASMLMSLLSVLLMQAFQPVAANTSKLRARALAVSELRSATESLMQDMGGVLRASDQSGDLLLEREQAVAEFLGAWRFNADAGVLYELDGTDLRRTDLALGGSEIVARGLSAFTLNVISARELHITLEAEHDGDTPSIQLIWDEAAGGP